MKGDSKDSKLEREIFLAAMEVTDPGEREAFLKERCSGDPNLFLRMESLLSNSDRGDDFLESEPLRAGKEIQDELNRIASGSPGEEGSSSRIPVSGSSAGPWEPPAAAVLDPLFSAYTIDSLIGRGGMGAVYRGIQDSLERPVAIKILRPEIAEDESFATRFRREALSMAKLSHPNLVSIFDYGTVAVELEHPTGDVVDGTLYFLVMEFIEGCDLHQLIRSGELEHVTALSMISQICDALEYAHGEGYVHRDIKPANIFVTKAGVVKVGDFGLAKLSGSGEAIAEMSRLTQTGYIMGTPDYMAPEQMDSEGAIDHRSDIYSLGVMFYEMLTGKLPRGAFPPPSERIKIDVRIDDVVLKAMQSEPDLRYQRASEVKEDVERVSKSNPEPVEEAKEAGQPEARRTASRKPALLWGSILTVGVLVAAFYFFGPFAKPEPDASPPEIVRGDALPTTDDPALAKADRPFVNSLGMRFVPVPISGGPTEGKPVLFSIWETRVQDYDTFLQETGNPANPQKFSQEADHPVLASWDNAAAFCEWLTERERENGTIRESDLFRLPSDHEWSDAVGIGSQEDPTASPESKSHQITDQYPWGKNWPPPAGAGNLFGEEASALNRSKKPVAGHSDPHPYTAPVGSFSPNVFGIYDLAGNVDEATLSWFNGPESGRRAFRGSSWSEVQLMFFRSSERSGHTGDSFREVGGFRCVLEVGGADGAFAMVPSRPEPSRPEQKPQSEEKTLPSILSVPTRDLPDLSQLPKGRARFWSSEHFGPTDEIQALDSVTDFVEVMIEGNSGWLGLRSNGDVLHWSPEEGIKDHRIGSDVVVMQRSSYQFLGELLSREGGIVNRTHPDKALAIVAPRSGIVDLAKTDNPEYAYSILLSDGSVNYLGFAPGPSPEVSDFVRIEGCHRSTFGIRQSGQLVCWGETPKDFAELQGIRFVDLTSNTFLVAALADTGEVRLMNSEKVIRLQSLFQTHGPMTELSSGFQAFAGRRLSDRRWVVWNNTGSEGENVLRVGKIVGSLGPKVESLHTAINSAVWIEVGEAQ